MTDRALEVLVGTRPVARLVEHDGGYGGYDLNYLPGIKSTEFLGLAMHDLTADYRGYQRVPGLLLQNLPEGALLELVREIYGKTLNLATDFDLLSMIGPHLRGRVRIGSRASEMPHLSVDDLLQRHGSAELFDLCVRELGLAAAGISGMQPKFTARIDNRATALVGDVIVKFRPFDGTMQGSPARDYPGLAINEFFALRAVRAAGIPVAEATLSDDGGMLVVRRFDIPEGEAPLGFDDACSLIEVAPEHRYHGSYGEMFGLMTRWLAKNTVRPAVESLFLLFAVNLMLGNGDAHRKNHGLVYSALDDVRLAPAYDVVSTTFYVPSDTMALGLTADQPSKAWPDRTAALAFGQTLGMRKERAVTLLSKAAEAVLEAADELKEYLSNGPAEGAKLGSLPAHWRARVDSYR